MVGNLSPETCCKECADILMGCVYLLVYRCVLA